MKKDVEEKIKDNIEEESIEQDNIELDEEDTTEINDEDTTAEKIDDKIEVEEKVSLEEYDKIKDKYTRMLADYDNLKRRSALEGIESRTKGKIEVFEQLLEVLDNFERALKYEAGTKEFKDGINLVHKQMIERLENLGLEEIEAEGTLDHNFHQAVVTETIEDLMDDEIIEVLQKGYTVSEKLVRPAMVKVNKK